MTPLSLKLIKSIDNQYRPSESCVEHVIKNQGLAGAATLSLIANCVKNIDKDNCYLEIGVYQAVNFAGVAERVRAKCFGVDDFSKVTKEHKNYKEPTELVAQNKIKDFKNAKIFKSDFKEFLKDKKDVEGHKVEVYFYDASHTYQDQVDGIEMAFDLLADEAIIFIDDLNSKNVQNSIDYLVKNNKELELLREFRGAGRARFNEGLVVLHYKRE